MGFSPLDFLKEKICTPTQNNPGTLKSQAQNIQKSGREGIRASCLACSSGFIPPRFPRCILTDARCVLPAGSTAAPGHAVPAGCPAGLGSCAGRGTAPVKGRARDRVVSECQHVCASWHNYICVMQSVWVLPATRRGWRRVE